MCDYVTCLSRCLLQFGWPCSLNISASDFFFFLFNFGVLVTQDNYTQYKPITKEINRVTSHQSLQWDTCLHLLTQIHLSVFDLVWAHRKFCGPDIWKVTPLFATLLPNSALPETSRSKAVLGGPVSAVQLKDSNLTPNQLWICGRILLWVSDSVNDHVDRDWREKGKKGSYPLITGVVRSVLLICKSTIYLLASPF